MELIAPLKIPIRKTSHSLLGKVDWDNLEFGKYPTDHMLVCDFAGGEWGTPPLIPQARSPDNRPPKPTARRPARERRTNVFGI